MSVACPPSSGPCSETISTPISRSPGFSPEVPNNKHDARVAVVQMGLWHSRTPGRDIGKFSHTRLGRFMTEAIGQPLDETHLEAVEALMGLLCDVACDETV